MFDANGSIRLLYYNVNGLYSYYGGGNNDVGYSNDLIPNYLLGLPDTFSQGSAQSENIRSTDLLPLCTGQLEDSSKFDPQLRPALGIVHTAHRHQRPRAKLPTRTDEHKISLHLSRCQKIAPVGLQVPGDPGVPAGLTSTYYKTFAPRLGIAYSPGTSGKTSIRAGWGMFYNPMEQLVLEQFAAEPPFGGSNILNAPLFNTPYRTPRRFGSQAKSFQRHHHPTCWAGS